MAADKRRNEATDSAFIRARPRPESVKQNRIGLVNDL